MTGRRIDFWGNFGRGNLGNERTLQAIIYNTRKHLPTAELRCICTGPEEALKLHNIPSFPISEHHSTRTSSEAGFDGNLPVIRFLRKVFVGGTTELFRWIKACKTLYGTDMLIMTGTGMLTDSGERILGASYDLLKWSLLAKICQCKLLFVSVGVEPTRHSVHRWFIKLALSLADYRSYRDNYSKQYLEKIGFEAKSDPIYPDLAFSLAVPGITGSKSGAQRKSVIGVGVMDYCGQGGLHYGGEPVYREYLEKTATFMRWLLDHNYKVRVLIGDLRYDNRVRKDLRQLLEKGGINYEDGHIVDEEVSTVAELMSQLGMTDLVIAPRYHNLLLALMLNKPALSISYNEKNDCLLASVGMSKFCHPIDRLDIHGLVEQFIELEKNSEQLKPRIESKIEEHCQALDEQYDLIFKSV